MNLINTATALSQLEENKWYYIESDRNLNSDILAIKLENNWIYVSFIGGEYDKISIKFEYSVRGLNEIYQHEYNENYDLSTDFKKTNLNKISVIALFSLGLIISKNSEALYSKVIKIDEQSKHFKKLKF
ncbi:hypothetical protein O0Q50_19365 [Priestia aryabhattai]|uniref:Uncharacterized protein n=1 Tax=Priestia aryabhattai TaxID=412384 RepID=A0AAX6NCW4_PRIAR|nr:hypothetical protein [Priestia aryabhattai]MDU9693334.1 hypothetical protein [Priestia aryabhattai]